MMSLEVSDKDDASTTFQKRSRLRKIIPDGLGSRFPTVLKWAVIGYLIRIAVMPLFAHEDVIINGLDTYTLLIKHQIYTFYPLPAYALLGSIYTLFSPFLPMIFTSEIRSNIVYWPVPLLQVYHVSQPGIQIFIFVSKIPMLVFDFATGFLLLHMINDEKKATLAFKLWMLCPISIFISYFFGQFDVIPTFFLMLGLYLFKTRKTKWSMLSLGLCATFKPLGLLLVPPLILIYIGEHKNLFSKVKHLFIMLGISVFPLAISVAASFVIPVFYEPANMALLGNFEVNGFWANTYYAMSQIANPLFTEINYLGSSAGTGVSTIVPYIFPAAYCLFLFAVVYWRKWSVESLFLVTLLIFYILGPFYPQWFIWILPLAILMAAKHGDWFLKLYLLFIPLYFIYICGQNAHLTSNLLSPTILQAYYWPGPIDLLNDVGIPGLKVVYIFSSIFYATLLMYMILVLRTKNSET
jgi:hypothetical protein